MSVAKCDLCGEPMPAGEEQFRIHGYSGPCPPRPEGLAGLNTPLPPGGFVQQRTDTDCVVAAVAMFARVSYERAAAVLPPFDRGGICLWDAVKALREGGIPAGRSCYFFDYMPAIVDVPSLNTPGGMHAVYWDGLRVYDPNEGRRGRLYWTQALFTARRSWASVVSCHQGEPAPSPLAAEYTLKPMP